MTAPARLEVIERLHRGFGYPPERAPAVADQLAALPEPVALAFQQWWADEAGPETLTVEGYTLESLAREHGMNPIAAFLTLGWLRRDPLRATRSLARGHDRVVTRPAPNVAP
jgi:hypothetical protein